MWQKSENWRSKIGAQKKKTVQERFDEKIDRKPSGCWEWQGARNKNGYGVFRYKGKNVAAHRFMMGLPEKSDVLHECDNPSCVNPSHLYLGDNSRNQIDAAQRGRRSRVKLSPNDVRVIRDIVGSGVTQSEVARNYGVHPSTINSIIKRRKWAHVD